MIKKQLFLPKPPKPPKDRVFREGQDPQPPVPPSDFIRKWGELEETYDLISGYSGAMAEDLKSEEDLDSAISDMLKEEIIRWDAFLRQYVPTILGQQMIDSIENPTNKLPDLHPSISVKTFEQQYPELSAEFLRLQEEQYNMFCQKMLSYGLYNISVGTNLENEEEKHLSLTGIWFRMNDKVQRLKQLLLLKNNNPLENEPVTDAWKDISVYAIISQIVNNGKWINKK